MKFIFFFSLNLSFSLHVCVWMAHFVSGLCFITVKPPASLWIFNVWIRIAKYESKEKKREVISLWSLFTWNFSYLLFIVHIKMNEGKTKGKRIVNTIDVREIDRERELLWGWHKRFPIWWLQLFRTTEFISILHNLCSTIEGICSNEWMRFSWKLIHCWWYAIEWSSIEKCMTNKTYTYWNWNYCLLNLIRKYWKQAFKLFALIGQCLICSWF